MKKPKLKYNKTYFNKNNTYKWDLKYKYNFDHRKFINSIDFSQTLTGFSTSYCFSDDFDQSISVNS